MKTLHLTIAVCGLLLALLVGHPAWADVLNMGGTRNPDGSWTGLASLETVPVGDAGNTGELSGTGAGGYGADRICGSVGYNYNIGKYEVTAGQYCEFLNKVAAADTYGLYNSLMWSDSYACRIQQHGSSGSYTYTVNADWANRPVNFVGFGDACRFANWLHNGQPSGLQTASTTEDGAYALNGATSSAALLAVTRKTGWKWAVTSEDEWYKAAYYKGGSANAGYWLYPTGSSSVPGRDMSETTNPGSNANYRDAEFLIGSPYYRTAVGEFELSDSPYGTFDQGGNSWEWNEAVMTSFARGVRGGSFGFSYSNMRASARSYVDCGSAGEGGGTGFRVSAVPEPTTLALLAAGGALLARRRRA